MVCVPGAVVSTKTDEIGVEVAPSTDAIIPRLRSAVGPVIVAPRSVYVAPTLMVAGLLPLICNTGAPDEVDVAELACPELVEVVAVVGGKMSIQAPGVVVASPFAISKQYG